MYSFQLKKYNSLVFEYDNKVLRSILKAGKLNFSTNYKMVCFDVV